MTHISKSKTANDGYLVEITTNYLDHYKDSGFYVVTHGYDNNTFNTPKKAISYFNSIK